MEVEQQCIAIMRQRARQSCEDIEWAETRTPYSCGARSCTVVFASARDTTLLARRYQKPQCGHDKGRLHDDDEHALGCLAHEFLAEPGCGEAVKRGPPRAVVSAGRR